MVPRIIYIGEVPARALTAGPAVMYRLFEDYPADRLLLVEDDRGKRTDDGGSLPGVRRVLYRHVYERLLRTRAASFFGTWFYLTAGAPARALAHKVRQFGADA